MFTAKDIEPRAEIENPTLFGSGAGYGSETRESANDYSLGQRNFNDLLKLVFWPAKVAGRTGSYLRVKSSYLGVGRV